MAKLYLSRKIESILLSDMQQFPACALTGPRQSGKSTLLQTLFPHYHYATLDNPLTRRLATDDPIRFLDQLGPFSIIDEIQYAPECLSHIKMIIDRNRDKNGLFLLTGSQLFNVMSGLSESLAGRIAIHELLGFSFEELITHDIPSRISIETCFQKCFSGFYPDPCIHGVNPHSYYSSYVQTYLERDIRQIQSVHDLRIFQEFLELLAARVGNILNIDEVSSQCGISHTTGQKWLSLLESTRMIYLLRSFHKNITKRVIKRPKLYFTDTGLLAYLLKYPDAKTLQAGPMAGSVFENIIVIELLKHKFNTQSRYELYFYRDSNHNEIDLVLDFGTRCQLFEIKLSQTLRPDHWKTLKTHLPLFKNATASILSFSEDEYDVDARISTYPWWKMTERLASGS
jgi:hypothetical protein